MRMAAAHLQSVHLFSPMPHRAFSIRLLGRNDFSEVGRERKAGAGGGREGEEEEIMAKQIL